MYSGIYVVPLFLLVSVDGDNLPDTPALVEQKDEGRTIQIFAMKSNPRRACFMGGLQSAGFLDRYIYIYIYYNIYIYIHMIGRRDCRKPRWRVSSHTATWIHSCLTSFCFCNVVPDTKPALISVQSQEAYPEARM